MTTGWDSSGRFWTSSRGERLPAQPSDTTTNPMAYRVTFAYGEQDYEFEDELDISKLWENAEIGRIELFEYAGAEYPEEFDYDLFDGPYCQAC